MSLINDMLRDLDQRRQEPSQAKFGTERLVPVSAEFVKSNDNRSLIGFILAIVVTLGLIIGGLYFWQSMRSVATPVVQEPPVFVPTPVATIGPSAEQRELEQIALRMRELEAQNRSLIEAQAANAARASATQAQLDSELAQSQISDPSPALVVVQPEVVGAAVIAPQLEMTSPSPSPSSSPMPMAEPQQQVASLQPTPRDEVAVVPTPEEPAASGLIRSPRNLTFLERDQLQVQEAMRLASRNQSQLAMQQLREFVNSNPNAHNSREAMIKLALQNGDSQTAQQLLLTGLSLDVNRAGYRKLQARTMLSTGQVEQAMQLLSTRIPSIGEDIEYHDILATAYLSVQNYEKAAQSYEALVQQNRGEGRWWYGLASAWDSLGRTRDAGLAYQQALKLPNLSTALRQRSQQRVAELGL